MATLRLRVNDKILDKVIWLLNQFNKEEVEILGDDLSFKNTREHLQEQLLAARKTDAVFYSLDDVDAMLEKTISKHEH